MHRVTASLLVRVQVALVEQLVKLNLEDEFEHIDLSLLRFHSVLKQRVNRDHVNIETANELRGRYTHRNVLHKDGTLSLINKVLRQLHLQLCVEREAELGDGKATDFVLGEALGAYLGECRSTLLVE